jgi:hypothetical protein
MPLVTGIGALSGVGALIASTWALATGDELLTALDQRMPDTEQKLGNILRGVAQMHGSGALMGFDIEPSREAYAVDKFLELAGFIPEQPTRGHIGNVVEMLSSFGWLPTKKGKELAKISLRNGAELHEIAAKYSIARVPRPGRAACELREPPRRSSRITPAGPAASRYAWRGRVLLPEGGWP